jgi:sugar phosphate isomerase/epimerase
MKLGIKIAPGRAWKDNIEASRPRMVEIWYNASRPADYDDMFAYLAGKNIDVGLHFWGQDENGMLATTSSPLMRRTIDIAARHTCVYVNIHPDLYARLSADLDTLQIRVASPEEDHNEVNERFMRNVTSLRAYADTKHVVLTVETVPMRDTPSWKPDRDRTNVIDIHQMPMSVLVDLARRGVAIANDFGHTASNVISDDREAVLRYLSDMTKALAPSTRLIHLGFIVPPYNGVDFHDTLDNPVLDTPDAIPNRNQMIELLKLFKNRQDVWILVEPKENHVKNYTLAQKIIASI